ncbi:hypothetical protein ACJZ2D_000046 [Fusarium nematophilum]
MFPISKIFLVQDLGFVTPKFVALTVGLVLSQPTRNAVQDRATADGEGKFTRIGDLCGNIYCIPRGLHFVDVNGDGLDDIVCVSPTGDLRMSLNNGNGNGNSLLAFTYKGITVE